MLLEVRLRGRGGQGIVTASEMLVDAAVEEGHYGQAIPAFGAERRGAPVTASARVSDSPIRRHSRVYSPDIVGVFERQLAGDPETLVGIKGGGILLVNGRSAPDVPGVRCAAVDATAIAVENGLVVAGWAVVNTAMLGAISKASGMVGRATLEKVVRKRWRGELGERNVRAALAAYEVTVQ